MSDVAPSPPREEPNDLNDGVGEVDSVMFYRDVTGQPAVTRFRLEGAMVGG